MATTKENIFEGWDDEDFTRFEEFYTRGSKDDHWIWEGPVNSPSDRYPVYWVHKYGEKKTVMAAHVVYEQEIGLPPHANVRLPLDGCDKRDCINPYHRKVRIVRVKPKKERTKCNKGHALNSRNRGSQGRCLICKREYNEKFREENSEKIRKAKQRHYKNKRQNWMKYAEEYMKERM